MLLPPQHGIYNKLSQRFISAVASLTREGRLYEIDTRLRPSGGDGALAVSEGAFAKYMRESAWTFELMAFTRTRVITGNKELGGSIRDIVTESLMRVREKEVLVKDIVSLRAKITKEFGSDNPWNLKYVHGGIIDLDFLAQYFILLYAGKYPDLIAGSSGEVFAKLIEHQLIDGASGGQLVEAHGFFSALFALVRLCGGGVINEAVATDGLKHIIAKTLHLKDFDEVKAKLLSTIVTVKGHFEKIIV
jgi:[glutamine synthetase] adenylyltransferase / [glutamine synthetase]-adenylyl-L-tyrosine phosphorylase